MKLNYVGSNDVLVELDVPYSEEDWYPNWLDKIVSDHPDIIFFYTTPSTDIFEEI